jgi:NAD+ synthase
MNETPPFSAALLELDLEQATDRIVAMIRTQTRAFKKRGVVVALSGGIDSSVVGALCVRALGAERVHGLSLPECDSATATPGFSRLIIDALGITHDEIDITPILTALDCYRKRVAAVQSVIPAFTADWSFKLVLPPATASDRYRLYSVVAESPAGERVTRQLPLQAYLEILAATNFKQRVRKMLEYYHADRLNYIVAGTPNRLEYDQGFFVKLGDGAADLKPIAHLYKSQVYAMAKYLGIPAEIRSRPPTTDTYSLPQSQEEFYFSLPYDQMDLCLYAHHAGIAPATVATHFGWEPVQAERVFRDIEAKQDVARYLHAAPVALPETEPLPR